MIFRTTLRIMPAPARTTGRETPAELGPGNEAPKTRLSVREAQCRTCEYFQAAVSRCSYPLSTPECTRSVRRIRPWMTGCRCPFTVLHPGPSGAVVKGL